MNEDLLNYVKSELGNNVPKEDVYSTLIKNGWPEEEVKRTIEAVVPRPAPVSTGAEDTVPQPAVAAEAREVKTHVRSKFNLKVLIVVVALLGGGGAFAYFATTTGLFEKMPYSEDNLVSGLVSSLAKMDTFTYSMSGEFRVEEREANAKPFTMENSADKNEFLKKYKRDYERLEAVRLILSTVGYTQFIPASLAELKAKNSGQTSEYYDLRRLNINDPMTGEEYKYDRINGDFRLRVTFETVEAIDAIKGSYSFDPESTQVDEKNKIVVFSTLSPTYFYFNSEPPKPFYEQLNESMVYLPPELYFKGGISATTDLTKEKSDWKVSVDVEGDFGDLIYKVAGDLIKKDSDFYLQIRNLPSIMMGMVAYEKNTWLRIPADWAKENNFDELSYIVPSEEDEAEYKEARKELGTFMRRVIELADQEKVLKVKNPPIREEKNGNKLWRYELSLNKESILPFVEKVVEESQKYETTKNGSMANDTALVEYLKTDEFNKIFDYYNENTSLILWVNKDGFIELAEYSIRAVPPDEAVTLREKQARLTLSLGFANINQPVDIQSPAEYKEIEEFMKELEASYGAYGYEDSYGGVVNSKIKTLLNNARSQAEISYDQNDYTYDSVCEDKEIKELLNSMQENSPDEISGITLDTKPEEGKVACLDGDDWYVIQTPIKDDGYSSPYVCIDSTGYYGEAERQLTLDDMECPL